MTDEEIIRNVLSRFWSYMDDRRADDWIALFDEKARFEVHGGVSEGKSGIRKLSEMFSNLPRTSTHIICNPEIEVNGDRAEVGSDVILFMSDHSSSNGIRIPYTARCRDILVRAGNTWLIAERTLDVVLGEYPS